MNYLIKFIVASRQRDLEAKSPSCSQDKFKEGLAVLMKQYTDIVSIAPAETKETKEAGKDGKEAKGGHGHADSRPPAESVAVSPASPRAAAATIAENKGEVKGESKLETKERATPTAAEKKGGAFLLPSQSYVVRVSFAHRLCP